jgi:hypothetical protein
MGLGTRYMYGAAWCNCDGAAWRDTPALEHIHTEDTLELEHQHF